MSDAKVDTRRLVGRLLLVTVLMFAFGFALVPLYDVMCRALGINGKTAGSAYSGEQQVDVGREVKVQFMTSNNIDMVWEFRSAGDQLVVHPGAVNQMVFYARNPSDKPMTAQAIPSIAAGSTPQPQPSVARLTAEAARASTEPTERSMPPTIRMKVMPTASKIGRAHV